MECLFCKIVNNEIKSNKIYEDEELICIRDINPQAPVHILIIPKKHIGKLHETQQDDIILLGKMLKIACQIAEKEGIKDSGYRIVINTNRNAGQSIDHIHFHLLGGRIMLWPPG
ncbi:MAG: histidine triad nucleotide-binding protein [Candidatus Omnitrophica bacterium]|nr:histidine triad nucleotide-binding protein [Candidatus Omnitrophota bacterium]MCM8810805.1 histidine triad nucleotide-binding protein [Candidatus Omnitrophota bacterium]MCM8832372.1 histidine triad nucleotide-binding protein [Candidatus Omnitrophota bacterium]